MTTLNILLHDGGLAWLLSRAIMLTTIFLNSLALYFSFKKKHWIITFLNVAFILACIIERIQGNNFEYRNLGVLVYMLGGIGMIVINGIWAINIFKKNDSK